jgi:hypothetical protein
MGDDDQAYDLNIYGYPTTYLVTPDWKVYQVYVGPGDEKFARLEGDIQKLLELDSDSKGTGSAQRP